jgi:release factor glutamine methyltransferase
VSSPPAFRSLTADRAARDASIATQVAAARQQLRNTGLAADVADLDARLIAQHVLGWTTERFLTDMHSIAPEGFKAAYDRLIGRRGAREPLAYIVGHREFWGLDIRVTPAVLVPRPETELLVEAALEWLSDLAAPATLADACTGSGCIAIALACERPAARIVATDFSAAALTVARGNAVRHGVANRVRLVRTDLLGGIAGPFDAIVANPPYVPYCDRPALQSEVADHEPSLAIFGGDDGMAVIHRLVPQAPARIRRGGRLIFEFGLGQDDAVAELIEGTAGLTLVDRRCDLQGIPRVAIAQRD